MLLTSLLIGSSIATLSAISSKKIRKAIKKTVKAVNETVRISSAQREQHLATLSHNKENISPAEKIVDKKIKIFTGSFIATSFLTFFVNPQLSIVGLPVIFYVLKDAFQDSYKNLVHKRRFSVDIMASLLSSLLIMKGLFWLCYMYLALYLMNRKLMAKLKRNSTNNIINVFEQQPSNAWLLVDGVETEISVKSLQHDDIVVVHAGEKIPIDGTIISGEATVDQHLLTGESRPIEKTLNDEVYALTIVLAGHIHIRVTRAGEETSVAQIGHILNQTVNIKTDTQLRSEKLTDQTVVPTLALAGFTWPVLGANSALIIINSHFRYRLNIISSVSIINFLNLAAQNGILIKNGHALETLKKIDTIVFDKTGTLTLEQPHITHIHVTEENDTATVLRYAAAAEAKQSHPIAKAIIEEAQQQQLDLPSIDDVEYRVGFGVTVTINDHCIRVGSMRFMQAESCTLNDQLQAACDNSLLQGNSVVLVAQGDTVIGVIELQSTIRPEAHDIIQQLCELQHVKTYIISGDQETPTRKLANQLGIDHYFAETLPENKADIISKLQEEGHSICYVGDGINDSIALKRADISVSLRGASTIAIDSAEIILMDGKLTHLAKLFILARDFEFNLGLANTSVMIPSFISLSCAVMPGFTLLHSMILSIISALAGFSSSMLPLIKQQQIKFDNQKELEKELEQHSDSN